MKLLLRLLVGLIFSISPISANAADDPFLGTWHLNVEKSAIAANPGVKSKEFVFAPTTGGVMITETIELLSEPGKKHVSQIPFVYGKIVPQTAAGMDGLLVVKADSHTVYWTVQGKGQVLSQLQVNLSSDSKRMTFRYLWSASDPSNARFNDRYVYEKR